MSDDKLGQCAHGYYGLCPHCYESLRAELAELRAREKEVPRTTEWHIAMREANQIHDADAYFAARSEMLDSGHNRHLFEAGYQRGFDAGEKVYAGTAAAAVPEAVAKDAIPAGWVFYSADASIQSSDPRRPIGVMLKRDIDGVQWWLQLTEEEKERTQLYSSGAGMTLELAIQNAVAAILAAKEKGQ